MKAKLFCRASHDGSWSSLYVCSWYSSWNPPMISPVCGQNMLKPQKWNLDYISPYIDHILFIMLDVHTFVNWYVWMSIWIHNPLTGVIMYITSVVMIYNSHITAIIAVKKTCVCACVFVNDVLMFFVSSIFSHGGVLCTSFSHPLRLAALLKLTKLWYIMVPVSTERLGRSSTTILWVRLSMVRISCVICCFHRKVHCQDVDISTTQGSEADGLGSPRISQEFPTPGAP